MCLVRLPVDRDRLHCIPLYDEVAVAVVGHEHVATVVEELSLADLDDEQLVVPHPSGWTPSAPQLDWPAMSVKDAVEVVASGTGVAIMPMAVARLHQRKDTAYRPVVGPAAHHGRARLAARQRRPPGADLHRHRPRPDRAQLEGLTAPGPGKESRRARDHSPRPTFRLLSGLRP